MVASIGIGPVAFAHPLGLGLLAVCLALGVVVWLRFRRRGLGVVMLCLSGCILGLLSASPSIHLASRQTPLVVLIDTSGSMFRALDAHGWNALRDKLLALLATQERPVSIACFDGELHDLQHFATGAEASLPASPPLPSSRTRSTPWNALLELGDAAQGAEVLLVSDGAFSLDRLETMIEPRRLHTLRLPFLVHDPARILAVEVPTYVSISTAVVARAVLSANQASEATLVVQCGDHLPLRREVALEQQARAVDIILPAAWFERAGIEHLVFSLEVVSSDDLPENNIFETSIVVGATRPVAYLRGDGVAIASDPLRRLLDQGKIPVEEFSSDQLFAHPERLLDCQAVLLNGIAAEVLPERGERLRRYVVEAGLGLLVCGAPFAFGPGGYDGSPLEAVLPLDANPEPEQTRHHILLVDASASMGEALNNSTRFAALRAALSRYLAALGKSDQVALVAFNDRVVASHPFSAMSNDGRGELLASLDIQPDGATSLMAAFDAAETLLGHVPPEQRARTRLALLSDGETTAADEAATAQRCLALAQQLGTLDLIVLQATPPAWTATLGDNSRLGVFTLGAHETFAAGVYRSLSRPLRELYHSEGVVQAYLSGSSETISVRRWVETALKRSGEPEALAMTAGDMRRPLMARWTIGNGRAGAVALACDGANTTLAENAVLQREVAKLLQWVMASRTASSFQVRATPDHDGYALTVVWRTEGHPPELGDRLTGTLISDTGEAQASLEFQRNLVDREEGESHWISSLPENFRQGVHLRLTGTSAGGMWTNALERIFIPYAQEYAPDPEAHERLINWVQARGGQLDGVPAPNDSGGSSMRMTTALLFALFLSLFAALWLRHGR